jgi:pimeloyl-ACP methyl ester carboxylesterase
MRPDSRHDLSLIHCPTLVLCGRQDSLTPLADSEEMAEKMPRAKLVVVEDCGHLSTMERPHAVTAVLRYWLQI